LNTDRIGHTYPAYRYEVSREKVREYAAATGVGGRAVTAERGEVVAPPSFAACFTVGRFDALFDDPQLGAHWNLLHGSQEYVFHRPVRVGDVLTCTPRIADLRAGSRLDVLTLQIDCLDADDGSPVVTSHGTLIFFPKE
jgi:acyl-CoA thioesterase FadM